MQPLPLGELAATPWSLSPFWFIAIALGIPALLWFGLAWRRALLECPNRIRRAGVKEMRRLLKHLQRADIGPRPAHLHAWLRAAARVWNIRTSAPCVAEVTQAAQALSGDATVSTRWTELWQTTEHGLYGPNESPAREWLQHATTVAATVDMPKRERLFPNRLGHWLPCLTAALFIVVVFGSRSFADVPWTSPPAESSSTPSSAPDATTEPAVETQAEAPIEPLTVEVAEQAEAALQTSWNDWTAHRNLALYQTQQGELNLAIAHAAAAFVQHPSGSDTRDILLAALGETENVDRTLNQMLTGTWVQRAPTLFSPASWQRLGLFAALLTAVGLSALVFSLYSDRRMHPSRGVVVWTGRGVAALGAIFLVVALASWNAYGAFNQPQAAILLQNTNASPVPTDLVPTEETSPLSAGSVVIAGPSFLSWREIEAEREISGWVRGNVLMPLYAAH